MPDDIFSALADPTRRSILEMLADCEELPASQIHDQFQVSPQAISQHLKVLLKAKLILVEKRAQQRIYRINTDKMIEFEDWSRSMRQRWGRRLDTFETVMKAEMEKNDKFQKDPEES
ncbi:metalloregulator ArsR/SmtB family transcription factor [Paenibacillus chitinolyticus]|uniref:ArsR/SmtB family transcription factor n=1 Tax=Paenibacillus chitinolyticus TaxID=79263 RepID=UPI002DBB465D|nr:metalloregulator ArsR/SmtB family transcription factor [Paenibacillus chitinolyticus]MEC0245453.1 metalloregulator ArsR/SmtB family transcription factor [Paenibacillus chitinolyticus]